MGGGGEEGAGLKIEGEGRGGGGVARKRGEKEVVGGGEKYRGRVEGWVGREIK